MNESVTQHSGKAVDSIQQRLTDYACALNYDDLPDEVIHAAKIRVIDTLGVLIGGLFGEPCRIVREIAAQVLSANGGASIVGTRIKTTPEMAAFANATAARYLEFSDVYHGHGSSHGHPSDVVMPVLAAAEHVTASGRDLILAVVLAYEIYCQCSDTFSKAAYCNTNLGTLATAAAAGKLFRLSAEELAHCISIAVVPNNILIQVRKDHLSMWKEVAAGQAGRAGVFSALLAQSGLEGPHLPFEGKAGWRKHVAGERFTLDKPMGGKGVRFKILDTWLRQRPCMSEMIAPVIASEKIAPLRNLHQVKQILVETNGYAKQLVGSADHRPVWNPDSREIADHSIPYVVAATLMEGTVSLSSFDDVHLWDPRLRALLPKIEVVENKEFSEIYKRTPRAHKGRVTVITTAGEQLVGESGDDADDLAAPRSDMQIEEKFRSLTEDYLGSAKVKAVLDRLWHMEESPNAADIPSDLIVC